MTDKGTPGGIPQSPRAYPERKTSGNSASDTNGQNTGHGAGSGNGSAPKPASGGAGPGNRGQGASNGAGGQSDGHGAGNANGSSGASGSGNASGSSGANGSGNASGTNGANNANTQGGARRAPDASRDPSLGMTQPGDGEGVAGRPTNVRSSEQSDRDGLREANRDITDDARQDASRARSLGSALRGMAGRAKGAVVGGARRFGRAFMGVGARVGVAIGVSAKTGAAVTVALAAVGGGTGAALFTGGSETQRIAIISDDDDCLTVVAAAKKKYGKGERTIPETTNNGQYKVGWVGNVENRPDAIPWAHGTAQRAVYNAWVACGSVMDENGYARMGSGDDAPYIAAVGPNAYGKTENEKTIVGSLITFYFDDGTPVSVIVGDTQGPSDVADTPPFEEMYGGNYGHGSETGNGWGHLMGNTGEINVLEFWCDPANPGGATYKGLGEGGRSMHGHRLESFTVEGLSEDVVAAEGWTDAMAHAAETAKGASGSATVAQAEAECRSYEPSADVDNSDIARAAITFAWPIREQGIDNMGTELYQEVWKAMFKTGQVHSDSGGMDCGVCVASAVLWSGSDDDYVSYTRDMITHMKTCPRWEYVGMLHGDNLYDEMQPGDVMVNGGHTFLYTGKELMQELNPDAKPEYDSVGASHYERSAACDSETIGYYKNPNHPDGDFMVFRCIDPEHSDKFTSIGKDLM